MTNRNANTRQVGQTTAVTVQEEEFFIFSFEQDAILTFTSHVREAIINEANYINDLYDRKRKALDEYVKEKEIYATLVYKNSLALLANFILENQKRLVVIKRKALLAVQREFDDVMQFFQGFSDTKASVKMPSSGVKEILVVRKYSEDTHAVVRPGFLEKFKAKFRLTQEGDRAQGEKSFIKNGKIDWNKLKSQLTDTSKASKKIKGQIPWFDQWIKKISINKVYYKIENAYNGDLGEYGTVSFSNEAQFLRAGLNCGGWTYEIDPTKAKLTTKVDASADITIGECKSCFSLITPRNGIMLKYEDIFLGTIRFSLSIAGSAGVGAVISAGLGLDIELGGTVAKITGNAGSTDSLENGEPGTQADIKEGAQLSASGSAFIGATVEATVTGGLEWLCPETPDGKATDFKALASVKLGLAGSLGLGIEGAFYVDFINGKFAVYCKSALCCGWGGKGSLGFEVDGDQVIEFVKWAYHQFINSNYKLDVVILSATALTGLSYFCLAAMGMGLKNAAENLYDLIEEWITAISDDWGDENIRIEMTHRLLDNPDIIKYMPPEAKGQLLWTLMQSKWWAKFRPSNSFSEFKDIRPGSTPRKRALILVFTWVQSKSEFRAIMAHIKPKIGDAPIPWKAGYSIVTDFLDQGEFHGILSAISSDYDGNLNTFYEKLRENTPIGYPVIKNNMNEYLTRNDISPYFMSPHPEDENDYKHQLIANIKKNKYKNLS